jgi:hypothetical protein
LSLQDAVGVVIVQRLACAVNSDVFFQVHNAGTEAGLAYGLFKSTAAGKVKLQFPILI